MNKVKKMTASEYQESLLQGVKEVKPESFKIDNNEIKTTSQNIKNKLAIIGTATTRGKAPYNDPNFEFWGVAHCLLCNDILKLDQVWEIHKPYIYNSEISQISGKPIIYHANKEYKLFGDKSDVKVILQKPDSNINSYEVFNRQAIVDKYQDYLPVSDSFYATNSIAWMILKGIEDGFEEIHLYGIHLETDSEWAYERPCNEFWLGFFIGKMAEKGIKGVVHMPEESDVLRGYHEYGYADIEVQRKKLLFRKENFDKVKNDLLNRRQGIVGEFMRIQSEMQMTIEQRGQMLINQFETIRQELAVFQQTDKNEYQKNLKSILEGKLKDLDNQLRQLDAQTNAYNGAGEQVQYFLKMLNA